MLSKRDVFMHFFYVGATALIEEEARKLAASDKPNKRDDLVNSAYAYAETALREAPPIEAWEK